MATADIVYHLTGVLNIFICLVMAYTATLRYREVTDIYIKRLDIAYLVVSIGYIAFFTLSQFHFWATRVDIGNFVPKFLLSVLMTTVTVDLIVRHRRRDGCR